MSTSDYPGPLWQTLGTGTYAIVKEAVHISTGTFYAVKVISKSLMRGREAMVRNEINVLKSVSKGHLNVSPFDSSPRGIELILSQTNRL